MHRSTSSIRAWDDHLSHHSSALEGGEVAAHEPLSEAAKKEKAGAKFAEKAVHVIPFVLFFCAFVLWFLSNPDVDVKGNSLPVATVIQGDLDSDGTGHLPVDLADLDPTKPAEAKTLISDKNS